MTVKRFGMNITQLECFVNIASTMNFMKTA